MSDKPTNQQKQPDRAILFEMIRSFVVLAKHLNLSAAVKELGTTRQTVRRHIEILSGYRGGPLFNLDERRYSISEIGERALPSAEEFLAQGEVWMNNLTKTTDNRQHIAYVDEETDNFYYVQEHPLTKIWEDKNPVFSTVLTAWAKNGGKFGSQELLEVEKWLVVFRKTGGNWLCTWVGADSAFAHVFGPEWARSVIGTSIQSFPGGSNMARLQTQAYEEVWARSGIRVDDLFARISPDPNDPRKPIAYRRLLLGGTFPNGDFALLSVASVKSILDLGEIDPRHQEILDGLNQAAAPDDQSD